MAKVRLVLALVSTAGCAADASMPKTTRQAGDVIATVLGASIKRGDIDRDSLEALVVGPLIEKYRRDHGIVATEAEVADFVQREFGEKVAPVSRDPASTMTPADDLKELATANVIGWKTSRQLYEDFGGTVVFFDWKSGGKSRVLDLGETVNRLDPDPHVPVGAYQSFLRQQQLNGSFLIHDAKLATAFWSLFDTNGEMVVAPKRVNFSLPWWER